MDSDVQKIKDRINIAEVVGQYVPLRRAGRNFVAKCPFHKERTPSFHVSPERGTYMCFGCGERGDIFSFIQKMDGLDFPTALRQLAEKAGVKLERRVPQGDTVRKKEKEERMREVCEAAVKFFEAELEKRKDVQDYLRTRGIRDETAAAWRLGYAPAQWESLSPHLKSAGFSNDEIAEAGFGIASEKRRDELFDRFRGRIIFPIFDAAGQPVAVSGRFFEDVSRRRLDTKEQEPAKYINSPETLVFKKSRALYGLDRARGAIRRVDCILLVEGQFDLLACHQAGLPFTVALSGTALTPEHLSILSRLSKRLVLALDADEAGIRAGLKSAHRALAAGFDVKVPAFPQGKDPADLARENPELLKAAVRTSKTAVEFFLNALQFSARDERGYKKTVEQLVLPLIAAMESRIDQEHFAHLAAQQLGVSDTAVLEEIARKCLAGEDFDSKATPGSSQIQGENTESPLAALEKKAGMLLFYFGASPVRTRLEEILGRERVAALEERLEERAEFLRFAFEQELGEHTSEEKIAGDMLGDIARQAERERVKQKFM